MKLYSLPYTLAASSSSSSLFDLMFDCWQDAALSIALLAGCIGSSAGATRSSNDIGRKLVLDKCQPVAQDKFSFLQPLNLQPVAGAELEQRLYRGIKIAMLLSQALKLRLQVSALFNA